MTPYKYCNNDYKGVNLSTFASKIEDARFYAEHCIEELLKENQELKSQVFNLENTKTLIVNEVTEKEFIPVETGEPRKSNSLIWFLLGVFLGSIVCTFIYLSYL